MKDPKQSAGQRRNAILAAIGIAALFAAVFFLVRDPIARLVQDPDRLRTVVLQRPLLGRLLYLLLSVTQVVVAVIPGEPVEILGGYVFGPWEGAALFILAGIAGSMSIFFLVRRFGMKLVRVFFSQEQVDKLRFLRRKKGREFLLFLIFTIPGTPKDLLSYFVGLTDISPWVWLLICSVGRIPSVLTSSFGGSALGDGRGLKAVIIFGAAIAVTAVGALIYRGILKQNEKRKTNNAAGDGESAQTDEEEAL
ncbi:MAG: TVP38/TMEM64 family protein [Oscillospiraceae bacterium]|nr:TVP38/TMEM64 family protein [Oscillospiraceae bacterium]